MEKRKTLSYIDDNYESISTLLKLRAPVLIIGLLLGIGISFITSGFSEVISHNIQVAFFLPFIVYIADAIGTQTETIYIRDLKTGRAKFSNYLRKELLLGLIFGLIFGIISGGIAFIWLKNSLLAMTVFISSFIAIFSAPLVALITPQIFLYLRNDPAAGSGPIATVIQDMLSVIIYGTTASIIIL